jgi:hypothetical protein
MSYITFSFNPTLIPSQFRPIFMARFTEMTLEYENLIQPVPVSPPAEAVPAPSSFIPVPGDELDGSASVAVADTEVVPVAVTDAEAVAQPKTLETMTSQELRDRRADLLGFCADHPQRRRTAKFPKKVDLVAEIQRLEAERRMSADSLAVTEAVVHLETAVGALTDAVSETSSKKPRKSGWANYTPEQRQARIDKMKASRQRTMANLADNTRLLSIFGLPASTSLDGSA